MEHPVSDEVRYRILRYLEEHPVASQRELASHLGVSVGKINYCIRALVENGWIKMRNFRGSQRKMSYVYVLTPKGLEEKVKVTIRFLRRKIAEYNSLSAEIERLNLEVAQSGALVESDAAPAK
ncbi:MAG: MarR family EPS-associated transcriptional regulator [Acidobacteria bacterium]|nr:MAG: MarR family EPS-associated transcriptional regulator [Acidobacteriota bacterium]